MDQKGEETSTSGRKLICYTSRKFSQHRKEIKSKLISPPENQKWSKISYKRRCRGKPKPYVKTKGRRKNVPNSKPRFPAETMPDFSLSNCQSSTKFLGKKTDMGEKEKVVTGNGSSVTRKMDKRKRRKRKKKDVVPDEAARLQRRARYLLIKIKQEQNLIDAYSGDGWKGRSREKIKPEMELQRAGKQILKCKLGIRDAIRQLHLLSEGRIEDSVLEADGSDFYEHVFCVKCKSREVFPDNDIIQCHGTCKRCFHQKCLEPSLGKRDQGSLCNFCECKMGILDVVNAHLGTCFPVNSGWEDIFKEATNPDVDSTNHNPSGEWPSEDSGDEDYDPEKNVNDGSRSVTESSESDDSCSLSALCCSPDEVMSYSDRSRIHIWDGESYHTTHKSDHSVETSECEIAGCRRQRKDIDYKKLHDEMFGKDLHGNEQSEDEDWGPPRRKRRMESDGDAAPSISNFVDENGCSNKEGILCGRKRAFRIPTNAVEKLRQVFAENELPSRAIKENLSTQLGIAADKVGRWFRNARYAALKSRKGQMSIHLDENNTTEGHRDSQKEQSFDEVQLDNTYLLPLSSIFHVPRNLKRSHGMKSCRALATQLNKQCRSAPNPLPADELQVSSEQQLYLVEMERLCRIQAKLQKLKNALSACKDDDSFSSKTIARNQIVLYVPVAEVKEKAP